MFRQNFQTASAAFHTNLTAANYFDFVSIEKDLPTSEILARKTQDSEVKILSLILPTCNLDAGQPEVVQRGSPWYEKFCFICLYGKILTM